MKIGITAITDRGRERENNEDAFIFCPDLARPDWTLDDTGGYLPLGDCGSLVVIADGMGGTSAGEVASGVDVSLFDDGTMLDRMQTGSDGRYLFIAPQNRTLTIQLTGQVQKNLVVDIPADSRSAILYINAPSPYNVSCQVLPIKSK